MAPVMVRLFLGLLTASVLLYSGLRFMGNRDHGVADPPAAQAVGGKSTAPMARGRAVVDDYKKIEADNRAALDRTLKSAGESN